MVPLLTKPVSINALENDFKVAELAIRRAGSVLAKTSRNRSTILLPRRRLVRHNRVITIMRFCLTTPLRQVEEAERLVALRSVGGWRKVRFAEGVSSFR